MSAEKRRPDRRRRAGRRRRIGSKRYRVAIRQFLNQRGWHGKASLIATVEDTSRLPPSELRFERDPEVYLNISDCSRECTFEFDFHTLEGRDNSLYNVDTLIAGLERFRQALAEEIALYEARERKRYR